MRAKLTKSAVGALQPASKPFDCRDTELKGFILRVQPTGQRSWFYQYRTAEGRQSRLKLGNYPGLSPDGARALALERAVEISKGIDPVERRRQERANGQRARLATLRTFLTARYEPWAKSHMKSWKSQLARIRSDFADYLDKPMTEIHPFGIEGLRQKWKRDGMQPRSINRDIQRLQSVLSRGVEWGVLERHPLAGLRPLKSDKNGRVRFLSTEEERRLRGALIEREAEICRRRLRFNSWRVARGKDPLPTRDGDLLDHLRPMVLLALNTGLRRGELFSLRWADINLAGKVLTVVAASAKSGQTRRVPLNSEAFAVLTQWRSQAAEQSVLVFPGADGARLDNVNRSWKGVIAKSKLLDFKFHDLRHTFASKLVQAGIDLNSVRELLGHSEIGMTLRYAHLAPDGLAKAVEAVV
jgi:integrase